METSDLLDEGIDVENQRILLTGEINSDSYLKIYKGLQYMNLHRLKPVELLINSEGGDCYDAMAIVDLLHKSDFAIHTIGLGRVMSAALLVLASGTKRFAGYNATFLYHNSHYSEENANHRDIRTSVEQAEREENRAAELMALWTLQPKEFWKNIADTKDFYFTANEAIELGVIDGLYSGTA